MSAIGAAQRLVAAEVAIMFRKMWWMLGFVEWRRGNWNVRGGGKPFEQKIAKAAKRKVTKAFSLYRRDLVQRTRNRR